MEKEQALRELKLLGEVDGDPEASHSVADQILLDLINDLEIKEAFERIKKLYA